MEMYTLRRSVHMRTNMREYVARRTAKVYLTAKQRTGAKRGARERPPPRGVVETKPVLPRGRETHALSAVYGRNEERACVRASSQKRQEVVGSRWYDRLGPTSRGSLIKLSPRRTLASRCRSDRQTENRPISGLDMATDDASFITLMIR